MPAGLRHPDWYLIAEQRFRRRGGIREVVQRFRGENFLVLWDALTGQSLRLSDRAAVLWHRLDGELTVDALWRRLSEDPATAPTQREVMDWVLQLVSSGLILSDHALDPTHLSERVHKKRDRMLEARAANPLSIKFGLFDPSRLLKATYPAVRWFYTPFGAFLIMAIILAGIVLTVLNWQSLIGSVDTTLLSQSGVIALFLSYPVMKALHEMGHGWTVLRFGGEVREAGVMLLLFVPVPYVEASEATAFPDPRARMLVGAAGIIAELVMASLALIAWLQIEPGLEKAVLYSFMVMGSLSTLLFNGNPLLKFDAYYVLGDWLEMPNLATRSGKYISDIVLSRLFGLRPETHERPDEARILFVYGIASLVYRLSLTAVIVLVISKLFYVVGLLLAMWAIVGSLALPVARLGWRGWKMAKAQNRVRRATVRFVVIAALVVGIGGFVPLPFSATGEGKIVPTQQAELRMAGTGVLEPGAVADGTMVAAGGPLLEVVNPDQTARLESGRLRVEDITERLQRAGLTLAERGELRGGLEHAEEAFADLKVREAGRVLKAPIAGRLSWREGQAPSPGTFLYRGDLLGTIIAPSAIQIELAFSAAYAGLLPPSGAPVSLLLPDGRKLERRLDHFRVLDRGAEVPASLMVPNGGTVPAQPGQPTQALAPVLVAWIAPEGDLTPEVGMRVKARIELPPAPLFSQAFFHLQRLFLRVMRV